MHDKFSRRDVLTTGGALGVLVTLGTAACGKEKKMLVCNDTSTLSPADLQLRNTLAYVDISTDPAKLCTKCQQFVPGPSLDVCGTCKILKGTVNPNGNCKSFVAKPA